STVPSSDRVQPLGSAGGSANVSRWSKSWVPTSGRENSSAIARAPSAWSGQARTRPKPSTASRRATIASPLTAGSCPASLRLQPAASTTAASSAHSTARRRPMIRLSTRAPPARPAASIERSPARAQPGRGSGARLPCGRGGPGRRGVGVLAERGVPAPDRLQRLALGQAHQGHAPGVAPALRDLGGAGAPQGAATGDQQHLVAVRQLGRAHELAVAGGGLQRDHALGAATLLGIFRERGALAVAVLA